jgi:hypothetical protein
MGNHLVDDGRPRRCRLADGIVVGAYEACGRVTEDESRDALRICGGEQHRELAALGNPADERVLHSGCIHHGAQVIDPRLEALRPTSNSIGQPRPTFVELGDRGEGTEPSQE